MSTSLNANIECADSPATALPKTIQEPQSQGAASGGVSAQQDKDHMPMRKIDADPDLQFQLRGHSLNPLIDVAQPLLALVMHVRQLDGIADANRFYISVRDHITTLCEEVRQQGYDPVTQLAYRYALCAFIDEAVLARPWSHASNWSHRSLLSYHHNETWGGEKFFTVLARMQMDPERYRDVLEFKYLCLCLGFEGKYGVQHNNREVLNGIIGKLHRVLRSQRGDTPERLTEVPEHVASRRYRLARQWPLWTPWVISGVVLLGAYLAFSISLGNTTQEVLESLEHILKP